MDLLKIEGREGELSTDLLGLIRELSGRLGNVQAAVDELRRHHLSGVASAAVDTAIKALGLDPEHIKTLFHEHAAVLGWLPRPLGELGAQRHHWPFRKAVSGSLPGPLGFEIAAGVDAGIETDVDGEILDGAVRFDKEQQLFVRVGVDATLEGDIGYSGPLGALAAQAAFKTGGAVTLANYFRHRRDETVFDALLADARAFTLPGRATALGLRSRVQILPDGQLTLPDQYVHVHARGFVQVSGSLAWGRQVVRAAPVKVDSLDLDESLSASAGVTAFVRFSQLLSGDFDLLLSPAPAGAPWLCVTLAKSRKSQREAGFKVGAEAGVEGLDRVGRALLASVLPNVERLVATIEARGDELGDLKALFTEKLESALDARLKDAKVLTQIDTWVKTLGQDVELRSLLEKVLSDLAVSVVDGELQTLQKVSDKIVGAVQELIRLYRAALDHVQDALKRVSHLSVGIAFAVASTRLEQEDTALVLEIDGSTETGRRLMRQILVGDFADAIRAAQGGDGSVRLLGGALARSGLLERTTTLGINLFGFPFNDVSILRQEWHARVSLAGDVSLGVKTELEARHPGWSHARTCKFLADTAVLATVGEAEGGLSGITASDRLALEIADAFRPTIKELDEFADTVARLGVSGARGVIAKDLALAEGGSKPFGSLSTSVLLEMGRPEIDRLLAVPDEEVRRRFTDSLLAFFVELTRFHVRDANGRPLLLWKTVQGERDLINGSREPGGPLRFWDDAHDTSETYGRGELKLLFFYCRLIDSFASSVAQLRAFRGSLLGLSPEQAVAAIRQAQRGLAGSIAPLVEGTLFGGHRLNYAMFHAFLSLIASAGSPKPLAVVHREADDRVFVYA